MRQSGRTRLKLLMCIEMALRGQSSIYYVSSGAVPYTKKLLQHLAEIHLPIMIRSEILRMIEVRSVRRSKDLQGSNTKAEYDHFLE